MRGQQTVSVSLANSGTASPTALPVIGFTLGDVAGIGPEVLVRTLSQPDIRSWCRPVVFGPAELINRVALRLCSPVRAVDLSAWEELPTFDRQRGVPCWNPTGVNVLEVPLGKLDARAGQAAYDWLVFAARAALRHEIDAITTAPLNKAALHASGLHYPGHTEILGQECGVSDFGMMLYLPHGDRIISPQGLGVVHVTLHTSIRSVPDLLTTEHVTEKVGLMDRFLRQIGCEHPRIAVCALNPHAGEDGLFGDEETRIIAPGVVAARQLGWNATGPLPADTLLKRAVGGEFDGVVAMYHDQGHIALKLIGFETAVNITLGLPIVRTSPSHGTGFDIAEKYCASAVGMQQATRIAAQLASGRLRNSGTL